MLIKRLERASQKDALLLSNIARHAKAHWGYPVAWLQCWKNDLTISPQQLEENFTYVLLVDEKIIGFCLISDERDFFEVDHCWITPEHIGKGYGFKLLSYALSHPGFQGKTFRVLSDPNARGFYEKFGFKFIRAIESQPKGRFLPLMEMVNHHI